MIRTKSRKHVRARGIVQGVGFRPFVYSLALRHGLGGFVGNDTQGVFIEIEGEPEALTAFLNELKTAAPPAARIERIEVTDAAPSGERQFRIVESLDAGGCETSIPPDLALCEECRAEMLDPANRRYRYPFINCTNCGPRFTIVTAIPYDRPNTTMARFGMCRRCRAEYENPADRRYHAQPIACPVCGPHAELCDPQGTAVEVDDPVQEAAVLLRQGKILAIKGLGGFHLACDAASEAAVLRLRERKHRPRRPLAVMAASLEEAGKIVEISPTEMQVLSGIERPIVLLPKCGSSCLAEAVAPGLDVIGVMLPYTPLHELLCRDAGISLVMTSGNLSDEPLCTGNEEALGRLCGIADWFLLHNRDIARPCDDSVVRLWRSGLQFIRRSRGYVPGELPLPRDCGKSILALGGDLKNASCLTKAGRATLSQHLGDLELTVSQEHAAKTRRDLQKLVDANPTLLVRDRHPDYVSRRLAHEAASELAGNAPPLPIHEIQHHHAHLASCLADNRRMEEVYGLTWDGTGYGDDGAIWGGEILLGDMSQYRRVAHLEYIPLVGGGRAVKEPWRVALAWLCRAMPEKAPELARQFFHAIPRERLSLVAEALNHESQTAPCCSMGASLRCRGRVGGNRGVRHLRRRGSYHVGAGCEEIPGSCSLQYRFSRY